MREIKFRAWDKDREEMLTDEHIQTLDLKGNGEWDVYIGGGLKQVARGDSYARNNFHRSNCVLMQYTGLKDKNGKEIYEGDILKTQDGSLFPMGFEEGAFVAKAHGLAIKTSHVEQVEVIGNIYENPDLLDG